MSEVYKFRLILDTKEDVFRDVELKADHNLEVLHDAILDAFNIIKGEMATFYKSDDEWNQGDEIQLMDMGMGDKPIPLMSDFDINHVFNEGNKRMLYVYDFLSMWTFFVEFIGRFPIQESVEYPHMSYSFGETPPEAPTKDFGKESKGDLFGNAFDDQEDMDEFFDDQESWN